jgi:hypothetical protein
VLGQVDMSSLPLAFTIAFVTILIAVIISRTVRTQLGDRP